MGRNTEIAWTDHTFNPWTGCQKVSEGCKHCYAEALARRNPALVHGQSGAAVVGLPVWGPQAPRRVTSAANWAQPLRWNKAALRDGVRRRVFCASLADVFESRGDLTQARIDLFRLIEQCGGLDWLLLTKRPENALTMAPYLWQPRHGGVWPQHVWIGTTVEDQRRAAERLPHLLRIPAPVRFVSAEPLLEEIDLRPWMNPSGWEPCVNWVITGGESGPGARPFDLAWARSLVQQTQAAGVPVFVKQLGTVWAARETARVRAETISDLFAADKKGGDPAEWPQDLRVRQWPT